MKFSELPVETQDRLNKERNLLKNKCINEAYTIYFTNQDGTRYFYAKRRSIDWSNDKGAYMPFGGGTYWIVRYGAIQFERYKDPLGGIDFRWCDGKTYGKSVNGTIIPKTLNTKKEVMELVKAIGIFNI